MDEYVLKNMSEGIVAQQTAAHGRGFPSCFILAADFQDRRLCN